jgi:hypothetical protein
MVSFSGTPDAPDNHPESLRKSPADILERAPYRDDYGLHTDNPALPNTGERQGALYNTRRPFIVLPAFLMRPDLTPGKRATKRPE